MIRRGPWLWGVRKTAGGMTARTSQGIHILQGQRAKGQSNPSDAFLTQQKIAAILNAVFHPIRSAINAGFTNKPTGWSGWNSFWHYNNPSAIDTSVPLEPALIPDNVIISRGVMTPTPFSATPVATASSHSVAISQSGAVMDSSQELTDTAVVVLYNETTNAWTGNLTTSARTALTFDYVAPIGFMSAGDIVDVYFGYVAAPGAANSNTSSTSVMAQVTVV